MIRGTGLPLAFASPTPQGCVWQRCRVHFARNLPRRLPKAHQGMLTAALHFVFSQETDGEILSRWDDLAASREERFPKVAALWPKSAGGH